MLPRQAQEQGLIADVVILQIGQFLLLRKRDKSQVNIALGNLELLVMDAHFVRLHDDAGKLTVEGRVCGNKHIKAALPRKGKGKMA